MNGSACEARLSVCDLDSDCLAEMLILPALDGNIYIYRRDSNRDGEERPMEKNASFSACFFSDGS